MLAVILAGGKGTRLKPFTMTIPKPLLPLGDVPILEIVIRQLADAGFDRIILTLGHMGPLFISHFGDGSGFGTRIEYLSENEPLGTAAPLRSIVDPPEHFLVMNGDLLTDMPFRFLMDEHVRVGAAGTICIAGRQVHVDYGVVEFTADGAFADYREKPVLGYHVSMGINVLSSRALGFIPQSGRFDMPELILALHRGGERVHCFRSTYYWQDIGRFDDYTRASEDFAVNPERFLPRGASP
jgi:NDP-mannose synthase